MTLDQSLIFGLLVLAMIFFIWGKIRYDLVAFSALVIAVLAGLVSTDLAFSGFGHPAVVTVALVLVISRALQNSGVIDSLASPIASLSDRPLLFMMAITSLGAVLSAFMNNVGALALLMPLCLQMSPNPARILMPLSFGTILGGLATLIGTPPNIVVASYRAEVNGEPFGLFDFSPVGAAAAVAGLIFIWLVGRFLLPKSEDKSSKSDKFFEIKDYIVELEVKEGSPAIGHAFHKMEEDSGKDVLIVGLVRAGRRLLGNLRFVTLEPGDLLIVRTGPEALKSFMEQEGLQLATQDFVEDHLKDNDLITVEAVVAPGSKSDGRSPKSLFLRRRYNTNLLAVAREGQPFRERIAHLRLKAGDVVLLQGETENLPETMQELGLLPIGQREIDLMPERKVNFLPVILFAGAIVATATGAVPVHISFATALALMILSKQIGARQVYQAIDWPVIILLAAMIPIGNALQSTGGTTLIANSVADLADTVSPLILLTLIMVVTMTLSDMMNNAATAVVMAPIAATVAHQIGVHPDPFLMAVAVGASCAFLTPIGHQNNLLVMGPGGYKFGDYWRLGLPLEVVIVAITVPLIALVWPL